MNELTRITILHPKGDLVRIDVDPVIAYYLGSMLELWARDDWDKEQMMLVKELGASETDINAIGDLLSDVVMSLLDINYESLENESDKSETQTKEVRDEQGRDDQGAGGCGQPAA